MKKTIHIDPKLKEVVKLIKGILYHVLSFWYLLIILIVLALFVGRMLKTPTVELYSAYLTFTINQQQNPEKQEQSDISNLITDLSSGGGGGVINAVGRLFELSSSNTVLTGVLFRRNVINNREDYLANHFLNIYDLGIKDTSYFKNFTKVDSLSREQNYTLKQIIAQVKLNNIRFEISPAQIFKVTTISTSEQFSKVFSEGFFEALSELYIKGAVSKAKANYDYAEEKLKEATNKLLGNERTLANWNDGNQNLIKETALLRQTDLKRTVTIYNAVYAEALKTFEAAKDNLENQKPVFQLIDPPTYPLFKEVKTGGTRTMLALVGAVAFFFFITITLYFYKEYGYLINELFKE